MRLLSDPDLILKNLKLINENYKKFGEIHGNKNLFRNFYFHCLTKNGFNQIYTTTPILFTIEEEKILHEDFFVHSTFPIAPDVLDTLDAIKYLQLGIIFREKNDEIYHTIGQPHFLQLAILDSAIATGDLKLSAPLVKFYQFLGSPVCNPLMIPNANVYTVLFDRFMPIIRSKYAYL